MPKESTNIGGRGGKRPGAGRKKKALADKIATDNPGGRPLEVLDIPELEGVEMPQPKDFYLRNNATAAVSKQKTFTPTLGTG